MCIYIDVKKKTAEAPAFDFGGEDLGCGLGGWAWGSGLGRGLRLYGLWFMV